MTGLRWVRHVGLAMLAVVATLAGVLALAASPASAHSDLVSTDPDEGAVLDEAPDVARLTFDEPVRTAGDAVRLFDASSNELESSARAIGTVVEIDLPSELAEGSYVVSWRVISADGDPVSGALTFSVGVPSEVVVPPADAGGTGAESVLSAVQGARYLALFVAAGLAVFWFLMLKGGEPELHERLLPIAGPAAVLAVLGTLLEMPLNAIHQQGLGMSNALDVGTWSGAVTRDEVVAAALVVVGSLLGAEYLRGRNAVGSLAGFFLAAVGLALVGHTRGYGPTGLVVASDLVHLSAATAWVGGLVGLVLTLSRLAPQRGAEVLARFSTVAGGLVLLVAVTGSLMAWRILRSWGAIVDSPLGRVLIVKVAIVLVVVAVASMNRFWLLPRLARGGGDVDLLRRTVRLEAVGLAAVLVLTGFLVERSPSVDDPGVVDAAPPEL